MILKNACIAVLSGAKNLVPALYGDFVVIAVAIAVHLNAAQNVIRMNSRLWMKVKCCK